MAPKIPDRWIPYKAFGSVIEGTRLICFKVPLKRSVQVNNKEIKQIWDIKTLLLKIPKLGAVIDLTNTNRYYDPKELQAAGVLHKKILMPGRVIPPQDKVTEFMETVDEFLRKDDESLVGVHCTHGLNRTGYMVCRYLRDRLMVPAEKAIEKFEKARGYKIERENYIADLLGKTPPPPDIGKETAIKPIHDESDRDRKRKNCRQNDTRPSRPRFDDRYNMPSGSYRDRNSGRKERFYPQNGFRTRQSYPEIPFMGPRYPGPWNSYIPGNPVPGNPFLDPSFPPPVPDNLGPVIPFMRPPNPQNELMKPIPPSDYMGPRNPQFQNRFMGPRPPLPPFLGPRIPRPPIRFMGPPPNDILPRHLSEPRQMGPNEFEPLKVPEIGPNELPSREMPPRRFSHPPNRRDDREFKQNVPQSNIQEPPHNEKVYATRVFRNSTSHTKGNENKKRRHDGSKNRYYRGPSKRGDRQRNKDS